MVANPSPFEALMAAVDRAGSQSALARAVGCSSTAVWKWVQSTKRMPAEFVLRAEAATGVSRHLLRPDLYPADLGPSPRWHGVDGGGERVAFNRNGALQGRAA